MSTRDFIHLLSESYREWSRDRAPLFGAALAFYTFFSLAPLLVVALAIAGFFFGDEAAEGELIAQLQGMVGREAAEAIQMLVRRARDPGAGILASVLGLGALALGATRVFTSLQAALDVIWDAPARESGFREGALHYLRTRFVSFALVVAVGFLLLVSLVTSAVLAALGRLLSGLAPESVRHFAVLGLDFSLSLVGAAVLFALIFKVLPAVDIAWRDVALGAFVTSVLFNVGKSLIGWYLGNSSVGSVFGAFGSIAIVLLWVYYSSQILLFGAELTEVYSRELGSRRE